MFDEVCQMVKSTSADYSQNMESIVRLASQHLTALKAEVGRYFPELGESDAKLIRNPFNVNVLNVPAPILEQLIDIQTDSTARDLRPETKITDFWCQIRQSYPAVSSLAIKSLLTFPTTYLCESGFSAMIQMKNKYRARLYVESDLRVALSTTNPRIERLVGEMQAQPSH